MQGDNGFGNTPPQMPSQGWVQQSQSMVMQGQQPVPQPIKKPNNNWVWWLLGGVILVAILIVILVVVAVTLPNKTDDGPSTIDRSLFTMDNIVSLCDANDLTTLETTRNDSEGIESVECTEAYTPGVSEERLFRFKTIRLLGSKKPLSETLYGTSIALMDENAVLMRGSGDYKEYFSKLSDDVYAYYIIGEYYMMTASSVDVEWLARVLKDYTDADLLSYVDAVNEKHVDYEKMNEIEVGFAAIRKEDMKRLLEAVAKHQEDNHKKLIEGPSYWEGSTVVECDSVNVACNFAKGYLSDDKFNYTFIDPDGSPYDLYVTENFAKQGSIATYLMDEENRLVETLEGYTIGGEAPNVKHIMYVVPGGRCGNGDEVSVIKGAEKQYAIIYQITSRKAYCLDAINANSGN